MKHLTILFLLLFSFTASSQTVYKTPSGEKYHLSTCRMVKNVSQELSLNEAMKKGLLPCKICNPPKFAGLNLISQKKAKGESKTAQCKGNTKAGIRCKHRTSISNGYCFQHNPD